MSNSSVFTDIDAESDLERLTLLNDTLCLHCGQAGQTKLLTTRIPYFRDIVLLSFECDTCHYTSNEVQPCNEVNETAVRYILSVNTKAADSEAHYKDLNRQIIKSETASIKLPEFEFEIPPVSQRGEINTIEGILLNVIDSLQSDQPNRELSQPEIARKLQLIIDSFRSYLSGDKAFTLILEDLAGNSFLENPYAPQNDPRVTVVHFKRTAEQTRSLGYQVDEGGKRVSDTKGMSVDVALRDKLDTYFNVTDRSAILEGQCPSCRQECETRMCVTDLPHFRDVVLMVTDCENCGFKDAEVKPAGSIKEKGIKIILKVTKVEDLKRDLLKSETASVRIPELELELLAGTLGGKYTTLEGILHDIKDQLSKTNPFVLGDSSLPDNKLKFAEFMEKLEKLNEVNESWTFEMEDPLGNIYLYSDNPDSDPYLAIIHYERSYEQNEELGLNDINTDPMSYLEDEELKQIYLQELEKDKKTKRQNEKERRNIKSDNDPAEAQPVKYGGKIKPIDEID